MAALAKSGENVTRHSTHRGNPVKFKAERAARIPLGRRSDPEEMARGVWLATEAPDYMTAARLNVTGGLDNDEAARARSQPARES
jgi:NAD(P)-dependent dehydrogenase (short-subunit alcohol dehydrogenase family)